MLQLESLSVSRGGNRLLAGLDLRLESGEITALTGPSGCGKTSLLRAIAGLDDATDGRVLLDGEPAGALGWPAFRRSVVLLAQTPVLFPGTLRENLARPFAYASASEAFPLERAKELLDRLQLPDGALAQQARTLSVGEQQRVALARALLVRPRALLLDEPTSALDAENVRIVETVVRRAVGGVGAVDGGAPGSDSAQMAVLVVTHDPAQADRWCDRRVDLAPFAVAGGRVRA